MAQDTPSRKLDQYIVRFPDGMRDRLKKAAAENKRSLNAEIVARLDGYEFAKIAISNLEKERDKAVKLQIIAEHRAEQAEKLLAIAREQNESWSKIFTNAAEKQVAGEKELDVKNVLDAMRDELHQLLDEKDAQAAERENLLAQQSELIQRLLRDAEIAGGLLMTVRDSFIEAAGGDDTRLKTFMKQFATKPRNDE